MTDLFAILKFECTYAKHKQNLWANERFKSFKMQREPKTWAKTSAREDLNFFNFF